MSVAARPAVWLVRGYQAARADRPSPCRFTPSCSSYALEALEERGLAVGAALAVRRLIRCHPWGEHRYDPVPRSKDTSRV